MVSIFTYIPKVGSQIDKLIGAAKDIEFLDTSIASYFERNNWKKLPNAANFFKLVMEITHIVVNTAWGESHNDSSRSVINLIVTGIGAQYRWIGVGTAVSPLKDPAYMFILRNSIENYRTMQAVLNCATKTSNKSLKLMESTRAKRPSSTSSTSSAASSPKLNAAKAASRIKKKEKPKVVQEETDEDCIDDIIQSNAVSPSDVSSRLDDMLATVGEV